MERAEKKLVPTELGFTVNDLLVKYFDAIFNVGFTAGMEEHLDDIAKGEETMVPVLREFYASFAPQLQAAERFMETVRVEPEKIGEACPECGSDLVIKLGRFGKFIGCSNYPDLPLYPAAGEQDRRGLPERRRRAHRAPHAHRPYVLRLRQLPGL